jgi:hypothetical protein
METQYSITITKRVPKSDEELDRIKRDMKDMFHYNHNVGPQIEHDTHNERNVLCTVLTEDEFLKVRTEVLKVWDK